MDFHFGSIPSIMCPNDVTEMAKNVVKVILGLFFNGMWFTDCNYLWIFAMYISDVYFTRYGRGW